MKVVLSVLAILPAIGAGTICGMLAAACLYMMPGMVIDMAFGTSLLESNLSYVVTFWLAALFAVGFWLAMLARIWDLEWRFAR